MEHAQAQPTFAQLYERHVVPGKFTPWAQDLIGRARPIGPADRVLDLGCGTGIVARKLRERLGGAARIVGVDANPGMLAHARELCPEVDWREGNAMTLPFDDAAFDIVFCQEMLQFVPDRPAAVREILRVLSPGGRLLLSTWRARAEQPLYEAIGQVAERHLGSAVDKRFSFGDDAELRRLLVDAGFADVRVDVVTITERHSAFPVRLNAAAVFDLARLGEAEREQRLASMEAECAPILARFTVDGQITEPARANVATAFAPKSADRSRP